MRENACDCKLRNLPAVSSSKSPRALLLSCGASMRSLVAVAEADRSRIAIRHLDGSSAWTYGELDRLAGLYARALSGALRDGDRRSDAEEGVAPRVAFLLDPGSEYVACTLASWRCDAIAFPLATMHPVSLRVGSPFSVIPSPP